MTLPNTEYPATLVSPLRSQNLTQNPPHPNHPLSLSSSQALARTEPFRRPSRPPIRHRQQPLIKRRRIIPHHILLHARRTLTQKPLPFSHLGTDSTQAGGGTVFRAGEVESGMVDGGIRCGCGCYWGF